MKLWSGRLSGSMDETFARLNNSLPFDRRLAQVDVLGSIAWAKALVEPGVLTPEEAAAIVNGLQSILEDFKSGKEPFVESDEDIHTAVERLLSERIGSLAGKLHTGRSRNDQVATDFRLWLMDALPHLAVLLLELQATLIARAEQDRGILLPGYTHFQQAQPILLSHWWLAHFWALQRDRERLAEALRRTRKMPLGSGALAGTAYPIDRFALAQDLGFDAPSPNSLDAVSDRDFAAEVLFWAALTGVHMSRLAEALILYTTAEFGFLSLADAFSTGSSLMPQKKNPDPLELVRSKSGLLIGRLTGLLAMLKGLPSAYDKDLQDDKPPVFEAVDLLELLLPVMSGLISTLTVYPERTRAAIGWPVMATDLADYLVGRGVPFRQAHTAVAQAVSRAEALGINLPDLPLGEWQKIHLAFGEDLFAVFDPERAVRRRSAYGGTAPQAVEEQIRLAKMTLEGPRERG
ncbi:MAG: argininosuccinate lyase [Chloroflexi bacterium]|nr:argininosuccinate lyase [Chloroflexota bacterium]